MSKTILSLLACVGLSSGSLFGAVVYEGFSGYTADTTVVGQSGSGTGVTGSWSSVGGALASTVNFFPRADGLSYTNYAPSSAGSLEGFRSSGSHSGAAKSVARTFNYAAPSSADIYISFLIDSNSTSQAADSFLRLRANANDTLDRDTTFSINHATSSLSFKAGGQVGLTYSAGLNAGANLIVVRAIAGADFYDQVELWVNPTITPGAAPTAANLGAPDASGTGIMRSFGGGGIGLAYNNMRFTHSLNSGSIVLDEFVITQTLSDIVPIPEPSTYAALFGALALGFVVVRRRNRK